MNTHTTLRQHILAVTLSALGFAFSIGGTLYLMHLAEAPGLSTVDGTALLSQSSPASVHHTAHKTLN